MKPPKPIMRIDAVHDLRNAIENAIRLVMEQNLIFKSCINCINFKSKEEVCGLSPQHGKPPARIIAYGCPKWEDADEIPF